ncbi:MAG: hypothetical protein K2M19_07630 [Muribaculaceae bacterium]|nr:hypothetical protein [Muribaculaceae bacterium]
MFKRLLSAAAMLLCVASFFDAAAAIKVPHTITNKNDYKAPEGIKQGFIGTPLLKSNGYKAEAGKFLLDIIKVQGEGKGLSVITDEDANTMFTTGSIASLTLGYDEIIRITKDEEYAGENRPAIKSGDRVGFVLALEGTNAELLQLDVLKMFTFNFYKDGEVVKTVAGSQENFDVLGLGLIGGQVGSNSQQVSVTVPTVDGAEYEFDGYSISNAGIDVKAVNMMKIAYAYLDNFVEVPLIKRYFPNLTAEGKGMTSGAKYLIDNNLENGASTAILNIGGVYYTVENDTPFPGGVEIGFHITKGNLLNLDLGKAIRVYAMTYPTDVNGNYMFTQDMIPAGEITTSFDVVGANVIGGGNTVLCNITTPDEPFFAVKLEYIKGVSVELGATVYNYAYVKLPQPAEDHTPFYTPFHIVPESEFDASEIDLKSHALNNNRLGNGYYSNTYHNQFFLDNSIEKYLTLDSDRWIVGNAEFSKLNGSTDLGAKTNNICMTVARRAIYSDGTEDEFTPRFYLTIHEKATGYSTPVAEITWHGSLSGYTSPDPCPIGFIDDEKKIPNLYEIELPLDPLERTFGYNSENEKRVVAVEYALFLPEKSDKYTVAIMDNLDNATEISTDMITIPDIRPTFELSGVLTKEEVEALSQNPDDDLNVDSYGNYMVIDIPKYLDDKVEVASVDLYEYNAFEQQYGALWYDHAEANKVANYVFDINNGTDSDAPLAHVMTNAGANSKIIVKIDDDTREYYVAKSGTETGTATEQMKDMKTKKYFVVANVKYTQEFKEKMKAHPKFQALLDDPDRQMQYAFVATSSNNYGVPKLTPPDEIISGKGFSTESEYDENLSDEELATRPQSHTHTWVLDLESLKDTNWEFSESDPVHFSLWTKATPESGAGVIRRAGESDAADWANPVNHNDAGELSYAQSYTYDPEAHTVTAKFVNTTPATDKDYTLDLHTRAYIPVRPAGMTAEQIPASYIAVENSANTLVKSADLGMSGVEDVTIANADADVEYFNLQGQPVAEPASGVYIRRRGNTVSKVVIR